MPMAATAASTEVPSPQSTTEPDKPGTCDPAAISTPNSSRTTAYASSTTETILRAFWEPDTVHSFLSKARGLRSRRAEPFRARKA